MIGFACLLAITGCRTGEDGGGSYAAAGRALSLPDVKLLDQSGQTVMLSSLKGKPVLIDFIYTSCEGPCPRLTAKLAAVAKQLGKRVGSDVTLVSVTLDPEHDDPAKLRSYAAEQGADRKGWLFLTGTPQNIELVLRAFGLRREREADGSVTHMVAAFLLDKDGREVRQYNGLVVKPSSVVADIEQAL